MLYLPTTDQYLYVMNWNDTLLVLCGETTPYIEPLFKDGVGLWGFRMAKGSFIFYLIKFQFLARFLSNSNDIRVFSLNKILITAFIHDRTEMSGLVRRSKKTINCASANLTICVLHYLRRIRFCFEFKEEVQLSRHYFATTSTQVIETCSEEENRSSQAQETFPTNTTEVTSRENQRKIRLPFEESVWIETSTYHN